MSGSTTSGWPGDAHQRDRRLPAPPAGHDHHAGSGKPEGPDLLKRDFTATQINTRYVGDITYLPLATGGNLYLATVIDCCSRRVAGWAIAEHMRADLVTDALKAAAGLRGSLAGAVFHADHGASTPQRISRNSAPIWGHPIHGRSGVKCR